MNNDPKFKQMLIVANREEVDKVVSDWIGERTLEEVLLVFQREGITGGPIMTSRKSWTTTFPGARDYRRPPRQGNGRYSQHNIFSKTVQHPGTFAGQRRILARITMRSSARPASCRYPRRTSITRHYLGVSIMPSMTLDARPTLLAILLCSNQRTEIRRQGTYQRADAIQLDLEDGVPDQRAQTGPEAAELSRTGAMSSYESINRFAMRYRISRPASRRASRPWRYRNVTAPAM